MNIHPIIVHFPIALLFIWSVCEILPVSRIFKNTNWKAIKNFLVLFGFLGALAARSTGEIAENSMGFISPDFNKLIETHSFFAGASTFLFGLFAVEVVLLYIISTFPDLYNKFSIVKKIIDLFLSLLSINILRKFLAILGFLAIFLTGLLGGVIVYGSSVDPIAPFVLNILNISL